MHEPTNSIYYTFSAIPQTIAGAIALLGAFILYKLQTINNDIDKVADEILTARNPDHVKTYYQVSLPQKRSFKEYCMHSSGIKPDSELPNQPDGQPTWFKDEAKYLIPLYKHKKDLKGKSKWALIWTIVTITYSIIVLVVADLIIHFHLRWIEYGAYMIVILLLVLCLMNYRKVITYSLETIPIEQRK